MNIFNKIIQGKKMKNKGLKKLKMFGDEWNLVLYKDKNIDAGGDFSFSKKEIKINDRFGEFHNILIHEILEATLLKNFCRFYGQEGSMEYRFIFTHTDFTKVSEQFTQILRDNNLLFKI